MAASPNYLHYSTNVERPAPDEQATIVGIIKAMTAQSQIVAKRQNGHAVRASHAKSTGLAIGKLEIKSNLAPTLSQGLFSKPGSFDVAVRLAQGPGEILGDRVSTHRGMAIKVFGVEGPKLEDHDAETQDFVLASGPTFPSGTAAGFLRDGKMLQMATPMPEVVKSTVASIARNTSSVSEAVTGAPIAVADFFGHPYSHPLSEPYYSQAPIRFGEYVAKIGAFPLEGPELEALKAVKIDTTKDENGFRTGVIEAFAGSDVVFEIKAQLWTDEKTQPLEDSSYEWSEKETPYQTIAILRLPKQDVYSAERQRYFDDIMSFRPAHSLEAHRPLGSIMRARLRVYAALSEFRHSANQIKLEEPKGVEDIPA
jgi:hypothetical protein